MPPPSIEIVIADDHPLFRSALRSLLEKCTTASVEVVAEAKDGQEALELSRRFEPELVLMDMMMPKMDGIEATRAIKAELPHTIVLVMTASEDLEHLAGALRAGAGGYILKTASSHQITDAIRRVLDGESPLNQEVAMRLLVHLTNERRERQEPGDPVPEALTQERLTSAAPDRELSPREVEVLRLMAQGHTNQRIAKELLLSTSTVKNHVQRILSKLGASDRTQAAIMAIEIGLLSNL
jgi:DNA-binding NarL/FixJ family response regulator